MNYKRKRRNIIPASALGAIILACAVGCAWNIGVESRLLTEIETETETESETQTIINISTEAEKATMLPTEMSETSTEAETEVMTEMSLPMETETSTECPTEPFIAPTTAIPAAEVQIIVETTNAPQIADISLTAEEEQLLMRVASLEAGNQGWIGMALVMNVILNRRQAWGKSIKELVYDKGQFSVVGSEKWNNGFIATEAPIALQAVKDGWDGSQGALFFCAPSGRSVWMATTRQYLFTAWGHEFYK